MTDSDSAGRGWFAAARGWLLGDLPDLQIPPPPLPPVLAGQHRSTDYAALLSQLLGVDAPGRQEQDSQGQEMVRLTTELARQQQLLALLVDRVVPPPMQAAARQELFAQGPHEAVGRDATIEALLSELRFLRAATSGQLAQFAPGTDLAEGDALGGAQLPLARLAPPFSAFDLEGDVIQAGADSFWAELDASPRTPWTAKAPYGEWAGKSSTSARLLGLGPGWPGPLRSAWRPTQAAAPRGTSWTPWPVPVPTRRERRPAAGRQAAPRPRGARCSTVSVAALERARRAFD